MSRSLVNHVAPYMIGRIRDNHRMLSASAFKEASSPSSSQSESFSLDVVHLSENCIRRMKELQSGELENKLLHLGVETGGCSSFQYVFELDTSTKPDDRVFEKNGVNGVKLEEIDGQGLEVMRGTFRV